MINSSWNLVSLQTVDFKSWNEFIIVLLFFFFLE